MNSITIRAFRDELTKLAILGYVGKAIRTGWEGPDPNTPHGTAMLAADPELKQQWMGHGINPETYAKLPKKYKVMENITTLGGLTGPDRTGKRPFLKKGLPVGAKSMMALTTAAMLPSVLRKEDPTGQERSRAERAAGLVGSTVGGLFGVGSLLGSGKMGPMGSNVVGGMGGSMLGERLFTAPWRHRRKVKAMQEQRAAMSAPGYPQYQGQYQGEVAQ